MSRADDPFDTYLLRVLCSLVVERSVSRTAIKFNQSQPAISTALKRLREIAKDPLLVREKGAMVPTDRALQMLASARLALAEIERLTGQPQAFDPATSEQVFRIGCPDFLSVVFLADVVASFRRQAPNARLMVHPLGVDFDHEKALAQGELDIVVGNWPQPPEHLHLSMILEDEIVCLVCRNHPFATGGMTSDQYLAAAHIVPVPYSVAHRGAVETHLATLRVKRESTVLLPSFNHGPHLLPGTDLVFTTSRHFAQDYARRLPLAIVASPIAFPTMRFYQLWHDRVHHAPAHQWLRSLLTAASRELVALRDGYTRDST
ncbi:LysR substrate-binding domain-containing protein [soil metagenome]